MGHKVVGPNCCVTHIKEPSALIVTKTSLPGRSSVDCTTAPCKPLQGAVYKVGLLIQSVAFHTLQEYTEC